MWSGSRRFDGWNFFQPHGNQISDSSGKGVTLLDILIGRALHPFQVFSAVRAKSKLFPKDESPLPFNEEMSEKD